MSFYIFLWKSFRRFLGKNFKRFLWKNFKRFFWKSFKRFQTLSSFPCEGKSNCFGSHRCRRGHEFETFQPRKHFSNVVTLWDSCTIVTSWVKMWFHPFPGWCHPPLLLIYNFPSFLCWGRCSADWDAAGGERRREEGGVIHWSIHRTVLSGNKYIHCHLVSLPKTVLSGNIYIHRHLVALPEEASQHACPYPNGNKSRGLW